MRWDDDTYEFNGLPFIVLGTKILDCQHGIDRKENEKEKKRQVSKSQTVRKKYLIRGTLRLDLSKAK